MKATKQNGRLFYLASFFFILLLCVLAWITEFEIRLDSLQKLRKCALSDSDSDSQFPSQNASSSHDLRILLGILTLPDRYERRHLLRLVYSTQPPIPGAKVDVKFVFCNLTNENQKLLIALEIMQYNDIIILNCKENINNGKTYAYFSSLPEMLKDENKPNPPYHYVMKADDDTYIRFANLVDSLRVLPREDLYYGVVVPCSSADPFGTHYMAGMGYLVSWDLVEWIRDSDIPRGQINGSEDKVFGRWLKDGRKAKNRFSANEKWLIYNYPEGPMCTHELWPGTAGVHRLKTQEKWVRTLSYFNVTRDLKPSKLYHIP